MKNVVFVSGNLKRIGGVSTHINRLLPLLNQNKILYKTVHHPESKIKFCNRLLILWWHLKFLMRKREDLVHFHKSFGTIQYAYWFIYSKYNSSRIVITLHNSSLVTYSKTKQKISLFFLRRTQYLNLLVVSSETVNLLEKNNITCEYLPSYMPSAFKNQRTIEKSKNIFLYSFFVGNKKNLSPVYGFDIALDLLEQFSPNLKMLLMVGNKDLTDLNFINKKIDEKKLSQFVITIFNQPLIDYVHNCLFLLRPNRVDGYGISIQEALEENIPAVASNVCERPKGTILFNSFEELVEIVVSLLTNPEYLESSEYGERKKLNYSDRIIEIYKKGLTT